MTDTRQKKPSGLFSHLEEYQDIDKLPDNTQLECTSCAKRTTAVEAKTRNFNTGLCTCAGNLLKVSIPQLAVGDEELRKALHRIAEKHMVTTHGGKSIDDLVESLEIFMLANRNKHITQATERAEMNMLGRLIPNFDGVGGIGYQRDDGSQVHIDVLMEQIGEKSS